MPCGASIQRLATSLRYTHAISDARLAGLFGQVFQLSSSAGALANLFQAVQPRLAQRVTEMLTRLRRSRLIGREETSAGVNGRNQWAWVLQNAEVCIQVIHPSRDHGVIQEVLGAHRPVVRVSDLYSAQKHHPAAQWQVWLAHQLRDGPFACEAGDTVLVPRMKALLLPLAPEPCQTTTLSGTPSFCPCTTYAQMRCFVKACVLCGSPSTRPGLRGRCDAATRRSIIRSAAA